MCATFVARDGRVVGHLLPSTAIAFKFRQFGCSFNFDTVANTNIWSGHQNTNGREGTGNEEYM